MFTLALLAFWPVWQWYGGRMLDGSDDPWGAAALLVVIALLFLRKDARLIEPKKQQRFIGVALLYIVIFPFAPDLVRAVLAVLALSVLILDGRRGDVGLLGLLLLSLPLIASLEFFLGYPVRLVLAHFAAALIRTFSHFNVVADGTLLNLDGRIVAIDTPCSGIKMLWVGLCASLTWSAWLKLEWRASVKSLWWTLRIVFIANLTRVLVLFFKESGLTPLPDWTHTGLGIFLFGCAIALITQRALRLAHA